MSHRRTIVGGRSDRGFDSPTYPRAIELLLKKAKADTEFCSAFVDDPLAAADTLSLELTPTEKQILTSMPAATLQDSVNHTRVARTHLPILRAARTAAAVTLALTAVVVAPAVGQTEGIEDAPYSARDSESVVSQRLMAIQEALESYKATHGEYPSTLRWIIHNDPLDGLVPHAYLFDAWYQPFHYEGLLEDGQVVGYRLESLGADLESTEDNLLCPVDPDLHSFATPNPIKITSPQMGERITAPAEIDLTTITVEASHMVANAEVVWILDRVYLETTRFPHKLRVAVGPGPHELVAQDDEGNSDVVVYYGID